MSRYVFHGTFRDGQGNVIEGGTIKVYNAGTTTLSTIYPDTTSAAINGSYVTSDSVGRFSFYIDHTDYPLGSELFDIVISKIGYTSQTYENVVVNRTKERDGIYFLSEYDSLSDVITVIGSNTATLYLNTIATVTENISIPITCETIALKSGVLTINTGVTLTINGPFDAGLYQVFSCTGTGAVTFGAGSVVNIHPEWWGAVGNGVADDTTHINSAITAASAISANVILSPGKNYLALSIAHKSNVDLIVYGATITKNAGAASTHIIDLTGATTLTTAPLSGNAAIGDTSISVTSEAGFAAGDYALLFDVSYAYGTTGRNQELNRVASVSAGAVVLQNRILGNYTTANNANLVKILPVHDASIRGGKWVVPAATSGGNIFGVLNYNCLFIDNIATGPNDDPGIYLEQSAFSRIENSTIRDGQNMSSSGYGYGICIGESSHNIDILNHNCENVRENSLTSGCRYINVIGGQCRGCYDDAWNTHGTGVKHALFNNIFIDGARSIGIAIGNSSSLASDTDISIVNCKIINCGSIPISVVSDDAGLFRPARIRVIDNDLYNWGVRASAQGMAFTKVDDLQVRGGMLKGVSANASYGILATSCTKVQIEGTNVSDISNGYGIAWSSCDGIIVADNVIHDISSVNLRSLGTNTLVQVRNNLTDDSSVTQQAGEQWTGNMLGAIPSSFAPIVTANGGKANINYLSEELTIAAAETTDSTASLLPAGALILGVSVRVTTVIPTAATFTVIGATSSTAFNTAAVSTAADTTNAGTASCVYYNDSAQKVRITPNTSPADATGKVRITVWYISITAPTS
jgi:hypothetical protein